MDKSGHDSWIKSFYSQLIIFSKNSCTCFPCSDEETADDLPEDTSLWVAKSEQDTVMSQPIWCTIEWLGTQQYRELGRVSRSRVLLWLFTSLQASPEPSNHRRGWVWVFSWHWIHGFYTNHPIPNIQQAAHCPLTSDTISVESGPMPRLRYQECPDFRCQPCVLKLSCFWPSD